jgi:hypothetical protein
METVPGLAQSNTGLADVGSLKTPPVLGVAVHSSVGVPAAPPAAVVVVTSS